MRSSSVIGGLDGLDVNRTVSIILRLWNYIKMLCKLEYFFILLIILCRFSFGFKCFVKSDMNPQFDIFLFVQQWPPTHCQSLTIQGRECKIPAQKEDWTIHGIWPTRLRTNGTDQPSCCNSTIDFDLKGLQPIREQLTRYWPSGQQDQTDESLWEYEWMNHGTCGVNIDALGSSTNFFTVALKWLAAYNMTYILAKSNIIPDNEKPYELLDIHTAIKSVLNRNPSINCYIDSKTGDRFLSEIRICFDRQLSIVDCDGIGKRARRGNIISNCSNKPIYYRGFRDRTTCHIIVGVLILIILIAVFGHLLKDSSFREEIFGT